MKNGYEYYYLFGLDIPLYQYGLGSIKQPRIIDLINEDLSMGEIYYPFIINDILIGQSKNKEFSIKMKEQLGDLTFFLSSISQSQKYEVVQLMISVLSLLYQTDKIEVTNDFKIIIDKDIIIDNSNFQVLQDVILESQRIDKSEFKFDKKDKKELDPIEARFEYFRNKSKKKKVKPEIIDMLNFIIHSNECGLDYNKVLNMTVYQVRNTLSTLSCKYNYESMFQYKLSQKFDIKEDVKYWNDKKIVKNSVINKGV